MRARVCFAVMVCLSSVGCSDTSDGPARDAHDATVAFDASPGFRGDASIDAALDASFPGFPAEPSVTDAALAHSDWFVLPPLDVPAFCPQVPTDSQFQTLLAARDYGVDARFVALSGRHVLVHNSDADQVLTLDITPAAADGSRSVVHTPLPAGRLGVGLTEAYLTEGEQTPGGLKVLACDGASGACSIWVAAAPGGAISELPGSALPSGFVPRGLVSTATELCAFGSSLICLRAGAWVTLIDALPQGDSIADVALGSPLSLAVSVIGRVYHGSLSGPAGSAVLSFERRDNASSGPLEHVSVSDEAGFITGHFEWFAFLDDAPMRIPFALVDSAWVGQGNETSVLTEQGDLYRRASSNPKVSWCLSQRLSLVDAPIAVGSYPCGLASNFRRLSASLLIGQNLCIVD